ncbi:hypothetical protein Tco_1367329 [Tanacetum coccineum]
MRGVVGGIGGWGCLGGGVASVLVGGVVLSMPPDELRFLYFKAETEVTSFRNPHLPELLRRTKLKLKLLSSKLSPPFPISLSTELKDLPSKFNEPTEELKRLKKQVHELEIELPGDLKEIPTKLEDFTKTITSLTSQVAELKTLQ